MSGLADRTVRLAARTLPPTIRDRYREEWLADVAEARSIGLRPASVAAGALTFAVTLDRDAPEIAGIPMPAIAQRRARWALVIAAVAATWILGLHGGTLALPVAFMLAALVLVHLWAAARLGSGLARLSAGLATAGLALLAATAIAPRRIADLVPQDEYLRPLGMLLLVGALAVGIAAWSSLRPAPVVMLAAATTAALLSMWWVGLLVLSILSLALLTVGVAAIARRRGAGSGARPARPAVVVISSVLLVTIAFGVVDMLLLTPSWKVQSRSLEEIYATIPTDRLAAAIGDVVIWAGLTGAAAVAFLIVGLALSRRPREGDVRFAVLIGLALFAVILFTLQFAGIALDYAVSEAFRSRYGNSDLRDAAWFLAQAVLLACFVGWVAPRRLAAPATA